MQDLTGTMDEGVRRHLAKHLKGKGCGTDDECIVELLLSHDNAKVYREEIDERRWFKVYDYIVEIDGMLIAYQNAECTGDDSLSDMGIDFDMSTIYEAESYEEKVTLTKYRRK